MTRLQWGRSARNDFLELVDYLANKNVSAADNFISKIENFEQNITDFPNIGLSMDTNAIRQILVNPARILYIQKENRITIIACIHQSQDWQALLLKRMMR